jgi:hypothetical protein
MTPVNTPSFDKSSKKIRRLFVAAASAIAIYAAFACQPASAGIPDGAGVLGAASEGAAAVEQVQFRFGGSDYCWYDDGWRGPGWYWCGYAYRTGYGWGGPLGWNNWRRVFRDHDEFREHREFRDRDFHDRDFHDRDWRR